MDKYFEYRYYCEVSFAWICVSVIILLFIVWLTMTISEFLKKKIIDSFMKKQGFVLKERYRSLAWYDSDTDTFLEFQSSLYKKDFKYIKIKYSKTKSKN